ncbi:hypothetical protein CVIRNUC_000746 [Coccomyxa viridis]|uniref:FHA domain-containing protein n=1 Tax=Coccomyxa viridis TaxID=1274662 RepID=A0AAV1HS15_9CHLO|nr:hypothetical protein CVIRNUC_000746 [Coccomyxa viridis]
MSEKLPDWAAVPSSKGWYVHTSAEDSQDSDHAADGKAGLLIGRNNQICEIEVLHKSASRVHACIAFDAKQQPFIVDLSSTHGTFLDGERLEKGGKRKLEAGSSVVTIGRCMMTIELMRQKPVESERRRDSRRGGNGHLRGDRDPYTASRDRIQPPSHSSHGRPDSMHGRTGSGVHGQGGRQGVQESRRRDYEDREHAVGHRVTQRGREDRDPDRYDRRQNERPARHHERHQGSKNKETPDEAPKKRHSSEEEDGTADERRQRLRKTGFTAGAGGAADTPAGQQSQTPAEIVRSMMGAGGPQTAMTLEQKKKLLWGKKPDAEEPPLQEAFGANRWDTAEFSKAEDRSKFIKLMGAKVDAESLKSHAAPDRPPSPTTREALTKDKQERYLQDVEQHFKTGLRRADGRTVGLGL